MHADEEIYKHTQNKIQNLIQKKEQNAIWRKAKWKHGKSLKNWKTLKQLSLSEKKLPSTNVCLKSKEELKFDPFTISELFKKLYSKFANDLVQKSLALARKSEIDAVKSYYNDMFELSNNKVNSQIVR